jgi:hypothetical protein
LCPDLFVSRKAGGDDGTGLPAKPLNDMGATPPVRLFARYHSELHQVSVVVGPAAAATLRSPSKSAIVFAFPSRGDFVLVSAEGR